MKRIMLSAIEWVDERGITTTSVPVRLSDGTWLIHDDGGTAYYNNAAALRQYADDVERESKIDGEWEYSEPSVTANRAIADLMEEIEGVSQ